MSQSDHDCLFCAIATGERRGHIVSVDDVAMAFLDSRPLFKGHVLVVPVRHVETLTDLPHARVGSFFGRVQDITSAGERGLQAAGTFVAMNNEDILSGVEGMAGTEIEEEQNSFEPSGDGEVVESLECSAVNESDEAAVDVTFSRFDPGTASDDYAAVHENREQSISELAENYGVDLGQGGTGDGSEVTTEEISAGDGGQAYSVEGIDSVGMPRTSTAIYSIRNLNVHVTYFGGQDLSTNEHISAVTGLSKSVERRIASTAETE